MPNVRQTREALGTRLRELRLDIGLNGKQFAESLHWLATKVSKIEHGKQTPTEDDIRAWAAATGTEDQVPSLLAQLRSLELAYAEWRRHLRSGTTARQQQIAAIEAETTVTRVFEPSTVPGLLQTSEYARSIITQSIRVHQIPDDLDAGVAARMARQDVLYQAGKGFHFILTEAVLRNRLCPVDALKGQIERLMVTTSLANVVLGVVPFTARLPKAPVHGFFLYDDRIVQVETFAAHLTLTQQEEIELYGKIFNLMHGAAVYGREAVALMTQVLHDLSAAEQ
ncbi:helix-turn-helix domain-containing protein [Planotetraspora kaengkrachanensis]|uniref:Transcriptional regulator n=1 Tax=Planotetraspora kaengkrachanensis TaxID=575193 RepID=A0A8J3PYE4_9ACTN|nr:helix-turn-helix transcriptional regulator [Planotetraspora kaengkrachanensis]GIG83302.1 transcriptional regulator [Planotetraspora kaengkrachanensis]